MSRPASAAEPFTLSTDVLVIGGGIAGLTAALHARPLSTTLVCKGEFGEDGSSPLAQGGIAAAMDSEDSAGLHARDTVEAGCGLSDREVALQVAQAGPTRIGELIALGARFDRDEHGELMLGREGAHSTRRIVHASGDQTGAEVVRALKRAVRSAPTIRVVESTTILRLIKVDGKVVGALGIDESGRRVIVAASSVVLATGGVGGLYRYTTNPVNMRGDGIALAAEVEARLSDLEFVQFHPTALADGNDPMVLVTEAMRGEGALLLDHEGRRLMAGVHPRGELAPRDVVARAIWRVMQSGGAAYLDARHFANRIPERFPTVQRHCSERGIDPVRDLIPVSPAAHYHMGGIQVDSVGRSSVKGLWACGEVSCTGLHGANRLASNSLLEALVFGARVGDALAASGGKGSVSIDRVVQIGSEIEIADEPLLHDGSPSDDTRNELREGMWSLVGLQRDVQGLNRMLRMIDQVRCELQPGASEIELMVKTVRLIAQAALRRDLSIGAHYRTDAVSEVTGIGDFLPVDRKSDPEKPMVATSGVASR